MKRALVIGPHPLRDHLTAKKFTFRELLKRGCWSPPRRSDSNAQKRPGQLLVTAGRDLPPAPLEDGSDDRLKSYQNTERHSGLAALRSTGSNAMTNIVTLPYNVTRRSHARKPRRFEQWYARAGGREGNAAGNRRGAGAGSGKLRVSEQLTKRQGLTARFPMVILYLASAENA
jgi:hypothetical protein